MPLTRQQTLSREGLVRAIGRWSLVALTINCILGSGIFGLPSQVADLLGERSIWAVLLAGMATAVIVACYAEVASQFSETGGNLHLLPRSLRPPHRPASGMDDDAQPASPPAPPTPTCWSFIWAHSGRKSRIHLRGSPSSRSCWAFFWRSITAGCATGLWSAIFSSWPSWCPLAIVAVAGWILSDRACGGVMAVSECHGGHVERRDAAALLRFRRI